MAHLRQIHSLAVVTRTPARAELRLIEGGRSPMRPLVARWSLGPDGRLVCWWRLDRMQAWACCHITEAYGRQNGQDRPVGP